MQQNINDHTLFVAPSHSASNCLSLPSSALPNHIFTSPNTNADVKRKLIQTCIPPHLPSVYFVFTFFNSSSPFHGCLIVRHQMSR